MSDPVNGGVFNLDALREMLREIVREELDRRENGDELLTVNAAAEIAKVTPGTIRRWITDGQMPARRFGRQLRIVRSDLEAALKPGGRNPARELSPIELSPIERARRDLAKVHR